MKQKVAILGAGAWGTALAHLFAHNGHEVNLWCYEAEVARSINKEHKNSLFLKDVLLPTTVSAFTDINSAIADVEIVVEAVPVTYLRTVLTAIIDTQRAAQLCWVVTSKGLEATTGKHSLTIVQDLYGMSVKAVVVAGPSFAVELVQQMPTVCMAASKSMEDFKLIQPLWQNEYSKLIWSDDTHGLLFCGAVKNVVAILLGMLDGAGYGKNTQAFMLTYAFAELKRLVKLAGGKEATVDGVGGFGDLFLTASTNVSKNRTYGFLLGSQKTDAQIEKLLPVLPEGAGAAEGLCMFLEAQHVVADFPIFVGIRDLLHKKIMINVFMHSFYEY